MRVIIKEHQVTKPFTHHNEKYGYVDIEENTKQEVSAYSDDGLTRLEIFLCSDGGFMFPRDCDLEMEIILKATPKKPETVTLKLK